MPQKNKKITLLESSLAFASKLRKTETYVQKNKKKFYLLGGFIVALTLGIILFKYYQRKQDALAQNEMFQAVYYFEANSLNKALEGDGAYPGFLDIIDTYGFTPTAHLAHFYTGVIYMHKHEYALAIQHLEKFKVNDFLLQARAWSLIGDALNEQKNYKKAAQYYKKAADYKPNQFFTPQYFMKAALAYEKDNTYKLALACYQKIIKDFPDSEYYGTACKHKSKLEVALQMPSVQ